MEVVYRVSASVRLAGKVRIVKLETNKFINAYPAAPTMDIMILRLVHACVTVIGLDMIARKLYAA